MYNSLAQNYFSQAEELRLNNKYKESVESYLISIMMNRNNAASYLGLGIAYKNLQNYTKAISSLEKAEKLKPFDADIQKELALCNIIQGDFDNGIKYLMTSIRLEPDNLDIQMQLALVHEMIEEEDMALMIYQKIIETNPEFLRAYIQKATLYMHLEDYLNCAKIFKKILELDNSYYRAYLALGICYEKLGNKSAAKRFYKKYIQNSKDITNYKQVAFRIAEIQTTNQIKKHNLKVL